VAIREGIMGRNAARLYGITMPKTSSWPRLADDAQ